MQLSHSRQARTGQFAARDEAAMGNRHDGERSAPYHTVLYVHSTSPVSRAEELPSPALTTFSLALKLAGAVVLGEKGLGGQGRWVALRPSTDSSRRGATYLESGPPEIAGSSELARA